jgi:ABC-type transport system involved in multi-copper enzyme maturation permease subunit
MKLLPIVGRELRESSRRRGTYWLRVRVAFQAVLIGIVGYFTNLINPAMKLGAVLFWGLAGVSMLFCLLAGRRSTADCISQEKREGTLGLLFLTDLKGYDVVLGKLAATSVTGLYALLAVFPVLAVPLLTGGMTSSEVGRMLVVLTNTFFFSIAIGIFASAVSREYRTAMATNFLLWLAIVAAPVAVGIGLDMARHRFIPPFFYSCPIYSFIISADANYSAGPADFWWSIGVTHLLAWFLALMACRIVPRTWGDKPERAQSRKWRWRDVCSFISYGNAARRTAFRKQALDANAYFWHAARASLKPLHVWLFLVLTGAWWIFCWAENGHIWLDETTYLATAAFFSSTFKLWITLEAGHTLGEDRRSGAFELLLATPLTVSDILRGQFLALRRQFLKPLLVVIVMDLVFLAMLQRIHRFETSAVTALLIVLPFDIAALICVAMAAALRSKNPAHAPVVAVVRILILPWAIFGLFRAVSAALEWLALLPWEPNKRLNVTQWVVISVAVDLFFGLRAWWSLRHEFRQLATQTAVPKPWRSSLKQAAVWMTALVGRVVPPRLRIPVIAGLAVLVALGVVHIVRPKRSDPPSPVIVSITQSNAPLRITRDGQGVFLILPDGSLWRWGQAGPPQFPRAAMPEQVGTNHNWAKVLGSGPNCLGLRADGTIWQLGQSSGTNVITPQPAVRGSNWVDIGSADPQWSIALKKDGTIWAWSGISPALPRPLAQIGTGTNWTAVSSQNDSYVGLQADGTLWAWGRIRTGKGNNWNSNTTNIDTPVRLCAETNWTALEEYGRARNQAGELWSAAWCQPNPSASAATVCRRITMISASYSSESAPYWMTSVLSSNGTLWTTPQRTGPPGVNLNATAQAATIRMGTRSDWVALWGFNGTAVGLTADGTLWAWGVDLGTEPVVNTHARIHLLQSLLNGQAQRTGSPWNPANPPPPIFEDPRPLMKLVTAPPP